MTSRTISKSLSTIILGISRIKSIGNLGAKLARALRTKPIAGLCTKASKNSDKKKWWSFSKKECAEPKKKVEEKPTLELCKQPTAEEKPGKTYSPTPGGGLYTSSKHQTSGLASRQLTSHLLHNKDPDLSAFGGTPYRTCGQAYIIQKERLSDPVKIEDVEQKLVEKLEKHPDLKNVEDPMPPFETVQKRMLDLDERKLHPLYKKYIFLPKKPSKLAVPKFVYKSRSGPVSSEEIPAKLKCKEFLDKKNIFADFKRVDPPRQLLAKMLEMQLNEKPTMEKKSGANNVDDVLKA